MVLFSINCFTFLLTLIDLVRIFQKCMFVCVACYKMFSTVPIASRNSRICVHKMMLQLFILIIVFACSLEHQNTGIENVQPHVALSSLTLDELNVGKVEDILQNTNTSSELSFVTVSEVYRYTDDEEGVLLFEKRLLKNPSRYFEVLKFIFEFLKIFSREIH